MQAHRTIGSEFLSLPTPMVSDQYSASMESSQHIEGSMHSVTLAQIVHRADLLPLDNPLLGTPRTSSANASTEKQVLAGAPKSRLEDQVQLLPTPNTMEHREIKSPEEIAELKERSPGGYRNLREVVINEIDDDSLLRTPKASEGAGGALGEAEALKRGNTVGVRDQVMDLVSSQGFKVSRVQDNLLPTPKALDGVKGNLKTTQERLDSGHQVDLPNVANDFVAGISWGKFEPAIRRWEQILGRPAPAPTKPDGKDGAHRLSSLFTEWMMGLPEGWITGVGLKRNDELKACGNGVVPQQAELALRLLLEGDFDA